MPIQMQEVYKTPNSQDWKRNSSYHSTVKALKPQNFKRVLKAAHVKKWSCLWSQANLKDQKQDKVTSSILTNKKPKGSNWKYLSVGPNSFSLGGKMDHHSPGIMICSTGQRMGPSFTQHINQLESMGTFRWERLVSFLVWDSRFP